MTWAWRRHPFHYRERFEPRRLEPVVLREEGLDEPLLFGTVPIPAFVADEIKLLDGDWVRVIGLNEETADEIKLLESMLRAVGIGVDQSDEIKLLDGGQSAQAGAFGDVVLSGLILTDVDSALAGALASLAADEAKLLEAMTGVRTFRGTIAESRIILEDLALVTQETGPTGPGRRTYSFVVRRRKR